MIGFRPERSWLLALVALAVCGPWPGWDPPVLAVVAVVAGLVALARPEQAQWVAWAAVAVAVVVTALEPSPRTDPTRLEQQLGAHCEDVLAVAERVAAEPALRRLFAASGEALDPELPFEVLRRQLRGRRGRSIFLADDRGRLIAWAGEQRAFPHDVRPLGQRLWGISWSAGSGMLFLREPVLVEGRLVGAVTVSDHTTLEGSRIWGMEAPPGCHLVVGSGTEGNVEVRAPGVQAVVVPVACIVAPPSRFSGLVWLPWLALAGLTLVLAPKVAWLAVLVGGVAFAVAPGEAPAAALAVVVLLAAVAVNRASRDLRPARARLVVSAVVAAAAGVALLGPPSPAVSVSWLPTHLLRPGWGGVWMVAIAVVLARWPSAEEKTRLSLAQRLAVAAAMAAAALGLDLVRLPLDLLRSHPSTDSKVLARAGVALPRGDIDLARLLPAPPSESRLDDLGPVLAASWGLHRWRTPSQLTLVDEDGFELSRWGDLAPAGDAVRRIRMWDLAGELGGVLELDVATEPWSWLGDWRSGSAREAAAQEPVWYAVLTRSGVVAATLHGEIRGLDAMTAGDLFHASSGWAWMGVGDTRQLARVWRQDEWLVAAVARSPAPSEWVLQAALACVWALIGLGVAQPPARRRGQLSTFGGRLRLLVAGGVVLPLVILTLFLNQRLQREESRLEQLAGLDALRAARFTAVNLAGGVPIDDDLARWLAQLVGGEVVLFDGAWVAASSRPDLMTTGVLPQLPVSAAVPRFLLGSDDPVVLRTKGRLVAAGGVELQERRLLLQLYPVDPARAGEAPEAVDWLLTGAILAAILALVLTSRVERRLSASLRDLVELAGKLLDGQPVGPMRRPKETDLAEVLDAVRTMNEEVRRRETSLRHQEELLRITLSTLAPAVMVLEAGGDVRFANPSAEDLLAEHRELVLTAVRELAAGGDSEGATVVETRQPLPGQELTWRVGVARVPLPDGTRGLAVVVDDITDVVRVDRLRQLNQLARIVAHEVKNPLTPVRLWVQELQEARRRGDPDLDGILEEACREIAEQVDKLQETAVSFSNLVALEHWQPEVVDLGELTEHTLASLSVFRRRGIDVVTELPSDEECLIMGDRQWLRRALDNLVKNSVDALGGGGGEVCLRLACADDMVAVEVEDTAGGVPEGQLQDLFSPHFSTTSAGSGLGLALVHQVVTRCQGRVAAVNGERGLVVRMEFPRA